MKCQYCQSLFESKLYNKKYCSSKCGNRDRVSNWRTKTKKVCPLCKENTILKESEFCKNCSIKQRLTDWSIITLGELQNLREYQISSRIRELARKKYLNSTLPKECYFCKYNIHFEIHHIKQINEFSKDSKITEVNSLDNLVALCRNHHWEVEHNLIFL